MSLWREDDASRNHINAYLLVGTMSMLQDGNSCPRRILLSRRGRHVPPLQSRPKAVAWPTAVGDGDHPDGGSKDGYGSSRTRRRFWARSRNSGPGFVVSDRHDLSDTRRQHRTRAKGRRAISARLPQCLVTPPEALAGFAGGGVVETLWASLLVFPTLLAFAVLFGFAGVPAVVAFFGRDFLAG